MGSFVIAGEGDAVWHVDFELEQGDPFIWRRPGHERYELLVWDGETGDDPATAVVRLARQHPDDVHGDDPDGDDPHGVGGSAPPAAPGTGNR